MSEVRWPPPWQRRGEARRGEGSPSGAAILLVSPETLEKRIVYFLLV
jgi:hypothetical protein